MHRSERAPNPRSPCIKGFRAPCSKTRQKMCITQCAQTREDVKVPEESPCFSKGYRLGYGQFRIGAHVFTSHRNRLILRGISRTHHSHSIINEARKSTWLKGFPVIDMGLYRRFYRQENVLFSGAGFGTICGAPTHHQSASIIPNRRQDFRLFCTALQGIACVSTRLCCQLVGTP